MASRYSKRLVTLGLVLAAVVLGPSGSVRAQADSEGNTASNVPATDIRRLRAKWVEPDADTTDANKIRRYDSMLRTGRALLRESPQASNAYMVRALMLQANRGLLTLSAGDVQREEVIDLAKKIVASQAPPGWRFEADLLLTQLALAGESPTQKEVREVIERFIARYEETPMTPAALMQAANLAEGYELDKFRRSLLDRLEADFVQREGVGAYLYRSGRKMRSEGRSLRAELPRVDKGLLRLPIDAMGTSTLVLFWDPANRRSVRMFEDTAGYFAAEPVEDARAVTIALGQDTSLIQSRRKEARGALPAAYLAGGSENPLIESYAIRQVPMFYLLGADGRIYENPQEHLGISWKEARGAVEHHARRYWLRRDRINSSRAGLFLVDALARESDPRTAGICREILAARLHLPPAERAKVFGEILQRLSRPEQNASPEVITRRAVLSWILKRYRDIQGRKNRISEEQESLGRGLAADRAQGYTALAVDAIHTLQAAHKSAQPTGLIEAFLAGYEQSEQEWAAEIFGVCIALETGQDAVRSRLLAQLQQRDQTPGAMGFLREGFDKVPWSYKARPVRLELADLQGRPLVLPDDIQARGMLLHFWSDHAPIASRGDYSGLKHADSLYTKTQMPEGIAIVSIYVGKDIRPAKEWAAEHPDWVHAHLPKGAKSEVLGKLDITRLPSAWLVGSDGSVLLDNTAFSLERELPETGKSVSILYHGVRKEDMGDMLTVVHRLHRYMQAREAAKAIWGEEHEEVMGMNQAFFKRSLVSVFDNSLPSVLGRVNRRTQQEIVEALDPLDPEAKRLGEDVKQRILDSTRRLARAQAQVEHIRKITRSDLWPYIRSRHQIDFQEALDRLWRLEIHWGDFHRRRLPTHLLDGLFERVRDNSRTKRKWDIPPSVALKARQ